MNTRTRCTHRVLTVITVAAAGIPLAAGAALASQGGAVDHKVTLCHRTNSEHNPYVVITIDKAGVFKVGHDGHDEGGVYRPGDKAAGIRWGDIIPPFDYYAGPQDERAGTLSHYDGLNYGADGQALLENGCQAPATEQTPPPTEEQTPPAVTTPSGSFSTVCTAIGALVDVGALHRGSATGGQFELDVNGAGQTVTSNQQDVAVSAGATLQLTYRKGSDTTVLQSGTAPAACPASATPPPSTETPPTGSTATPPAATVTTNAGGTSVLPETQVKGVKVGRTPREAGAGPAAGAPASRTDVLGTQAGALPHTGTSLDLPWVLAVGGLLLLCGGGLAAAAAIRRR